LKNWLFDELSHAGEEHLSTQEVARYDQKAQVHLAGELTCLERLGLGPKQTFVDLGAGTGALAIEIARRGLRAVAVDVSPTMLAFAKQNAKASGVITLELVQAGFLTYQHEGEPADIIYSRNALHHLPDFWKVLALERITRMLKPGGIFRLRDLVYSFAPRDSETHFETWLAKAPLTTAEGVPKAEIEAHIRGEYSTFSWLLEAMLERVGFEIAEVNYSTSGIFAAYTCFLH
jgi:ubiquinone/menaquinone biosynthesis C-methylase UbiE